MINKTINQCELKCGYDLYKHEYEAKALEVLRSGWYILGKELDNFENEFATYLGVKNCIGVASGLDALCIALHLLGIHEGDEVIVPANTYIATVMAITRNGGIPIFVEPDDYYSIDSNRIEEVITDRTKAIMVVHLYGIPANLNHIKKICEDYGLFLVEDCAQSHGATYDGKQTGTFGNVGCFSFYPTKNLGAFGDGGCIVTNDDDLAEKIRIYRNYGSEKKYHNKVIGVNSRLDELQAGLLRVKLQHIDELIDDRRVMADRYTYGVTNDLIALPKERPAGKAVWHQYVVKCEKRNDLMKYLSDRGINTMIHYPIPPHLSEAYSYLGYKKGDFPVTEHYSETMVSLPLYDGMSDEDQNYVIETLNQFYI